MSNNTRDIANYAPFDVPLKVILTYFQSTKNSLEFEFRAWLSASSFTSDEQSFAVLTDRFSIEGAQFDGVKSANPELFKAIDQRIKELGEVSEDILLDNWSIDALKRVFIINRENVQQKTLEAKVFTDSFEDGFTAQMQSPDNLQLRQMVGGFCLSFAAGVQRPNQRIYQTILEGLQG